MDGRATVSWLLILTHKPRERILVCSWVCGW